LYSAKIIKTQRGKQNGTTAPMPENDTLFPEMNNVRDALSRARLYAILDTMYVALTELPAVAKAMVQGQADIVQLRAKNLQPDAIADLATSVVPVFRDAGIPLIINDHPHVAARVGANGVHVGQDDLPIAEARGVFAGQTQLIIGKSTHSIEQATAAIEECPDYIAYGPLYANLTKPDYSPVGLDNIRAVHEIADRASLPVFCIGGIKEHNLDAVLGAGARRVVIVSELLKASDIPAYCRRIKAKLNAQTWL
jgi:thiamine-phosphate pyrophosphorylase